MNVRNSKPGLVTVVTPSLNQGQYIAQTIDSVSAQTYRHVEHIVVDGASSDCTTRVVQPYLNKIQFISEPDNGQADAINKGIKLGVGEFICYLNSDDILCPGALEKMATALMQNPSVHVVYGKADYISADGGFLRAYGTREYSLDALIEECFICQPATMWRRSLHSTAGFFDDAYQFALDYEFWMRLATTGHHFQYIDAKLALSRTHADAKTVTGRLELTREVIRIQKKHLDSVLLRWRLLELAYRAERKWRLSNQQTAVLVRFFMRMWRVYRHFFSRRPQTKVVGKRPDATTTAQPPR